MSNEIKRLYQFGRFRVDTANRRLTCDGELIPLKAKAVELLLLLIRYQGEVVEKDDLMKWLWPDSFVEESNLTQHIYTLRKALGERECIETIPRRGYRFAIPVMECEDIPPELVLLREKTRTSISIEEDLEDTGSINIHPATIIEPAVAISARDSRTAKASARRRQIRWLVAACLIAATGSVVLYFRPSPPPFERARLSRMTTSGKLLRAAISPDGRYLSYVLAEGNVKSIWLRQLGTGKEIEIVPAAELEWLFGLTFSHDGNYIYYVSQEMNNLGILFQVPSLGGKPVRLYEDVDSAVSVSPDDRTLAFIRGGRGFISLILGNVDGTGEKTLASTSITSPARLGPTWTIPPSWSPDGKSIAAAVGVSATEGAYQTIWSYRTDNGEGRPLTSARWQEVGQMQWLADGSAILVAASELGTSSAKQIWMIAARDGGVKRITNDLSDYRDLSLTSDARTMIAVQIDRRANIWLASAGDTSHPRQLTTTNYDGLDGLSCLPDGRIFYTQQAGDEENIWVTDPDGSNSRQLTSHCGLNLDPVASPDGRFVAFVSTRSGHHHIWRIDADGKNPIELTQGNMDTYPDVTPDGKWVTYTALVNGRGDIFRVPIEGGQVERVTSFGALSSAVSPDGNFIAVIHRPERIIGNKIATYSFRDSSVRLISDLPAAYGRFRWTPDGLGIAYSERKSPGGNIWVQPISGGTPRQLTFWKAAPVFSFAWSQDGKWLAYAVGTQSGDAVQITDTGR